MLFIPTPASATMVLFGISLFSFQTIKVKKKKKKKYNNDGQVALLSLRS